MRGIYWLLMDTRPGTNLFFSFSGHGSQVKDYSGDELNGLDETILPCDFKMAGQITDDELNDRLIKPIMPGVTMNCIIDACHSGNTYVQAEFCRPAALLHVTLVPQKQVHMCLQPRFGNSRFCVAPMLDLW